MASFAIPLAISGISALGGLLGNRKKEITTDISSTDKSSGTNMPMLDSQQQIMRSLLMNQFLGRNESEDDFWGGYRRQGLNQINQAGDIGQENISNILASRGLGRTTAGGSALISNQLNRLNQQTGFLNQIPQLMDQRNRQNLLDSAGFFSSLPVGSQMQSESNRTGKQTSTDPGNPMAGLFGGLGVTLAGLYGKGAFGAKTPSAGNV